MPGRNIMPTDFHELRLYHVAVGRMNDMVARVRGPLAPLFQRHGIRPAGYWVTQSGPDFPLLVYLTPWPSLEARNQAWAGFYADPEWHRVRAETNAGSELVIRYELNFLRAVRPLELSRITATMALELYMPEIAIGASGGAHQLMRELAEAPPPSAPAVLGAFEFMTGDDLPRAALLLGWDRETCDARSTAALEQAPLGRARRYALRSITTDPDGRDRDTFLSD